MHRSCELEKDKVKVEANNSRVIDTRSLQSKLAGNDHGIIRPMTERAV